MAVDTANALGRCSKKIQVPAISLYSDVASVALSGLTDWITVDRLRVVINKVLLLSRLLPRRRGKHPGYRAQNADASPTF
jgi:hypothetical protein